jgi:hypothetical protein
MCVRLEVGNSLCWFYKNLCLNIEAAKSFRFVTLPYGKPLRSKPI